MKSRFGKYGDIKRKKLLRENKFKFSKLKTNIKLSKLSAKSKLFRQVKAN